MRFAKLLYRCGRIVVFFTAHEVVRIQYDSELQFRCLRFQLLFRDGWGVPLPVTIQQILPEALNFPVYLAGQRNNTTTKVYRTLVAGGAALNYAPRSSFGHCMQNLCANIIKMSVFLVNFTL